MMPYIFVSIVSELREILASFIYLQNPYAPLLGAASLCLITGGLLQSQLGFFKIGSLARFLLQIHGALKKEGKTLLIGHIQAGDRLWVTLSYAGVIEKIGQDAFFPDMDETLEFAEDQILCGGLCEVPDREYALSEMDIFVGFNEEEMGIVAKRLLLETYTRGEMIIREGDRDCDFFMLVSGMVSVKVQLENSRHYRRLNSITAGVTFGEIALLDNKPRSANVVAEGNVTLYRLPYEKFLDLRKSAPDVTNKLILNMALNLSTRLRLNTEEIRLLVEN